MHKLIFAVAVLTLSPIASADLAPEVYRALQQESAEVLQIEVQSVDIDRDFHKPEGCGWLDFEIERHLVVKAKVQSVVRSRTNLRPGDVVEIRYTSFKRCSGWVGPRSIPVLEEGDRVPAYLVKKNRGYEPAARGASFESEIVTR